MRTFLIFSPECFIWYNNDRGVIYDSVKRKTHRFSITPAIIEMCRILTDESNLNTVDITGYTYNVELSKWIEVIVNNKLGVIRELNNEDPRPSEIPPVLHILRSVEKKYVDYQEEEMVSYLKEVTICLGDDKETGIEEKISLQLDVPVPTKEKLSRSEVELFLSKLKDIDKIKINIIGNSALDESNLYFFDILERHHAKYTINISSKEILPHVVRKENRWIRFTDHLNVWCIPNDIKQVFDVLNDSGGGYKLGIIVADIEDYEQTLQLTEEFNLADFSVNPYYNGNNLYFFEEYVYLAQEDIEDQNLSKRDVFIRQEVNTNFFGKLYLKPGGAIHSNSNLAKLGWIDEDLYKLVYKELKSRNSWRLTRNTVEPCKECEYRCLCPPISNYELCIGKYNLCKIVRS